MTYFSCVNTSVPFWVRGWVYENGILQNFSSAVAPLGAQYESTNSQEFESFSDL